ncbi:MAG: hypothetical protein Q8Q23_01220, partial [bacterium]|nr:hypothetical protein [bacterium]
EAWIGLELPMNDPLQDGIHSGVLGGPADPRNIGGYHVDGQVAVDLLNAKSPKAAKWWRQNAPTVLFAQLVFAKDTCRVVS